MNSNSRIIDAAQGTPRNVVHTSSRAWDGIKLVSVVEDVTRVTRVRFKRDYDSIAVYLGGRLKAFNINVDNGPKLIKPPVEGDIFIFPADAEVEVSVWGGHIEYAEIRILSDSSLGRLHASEQFKLEHYLGIRDEFIYRSVRKLIQLRSDGVENKFGSSLASTLSYYFQMNYSNLSTDASEVESSQLTPVIKQKLERYLQANLGNRITLRTMSDVAMIPPRRFLPAFREVFGVTPIQHLIRLRITRASELLASNSVDITEVALLTGFSNHAHLTRTFRAHVGVSPSEYRKRLKA